jgi:hypothetical protein
MPTQTSSSRKWLFVLLIVFVFLAAGAGYLAWRTQNLDEGVREWMVEAISDRFDSQVELGAVHVSIFPRPSITGENLTIHFDGRTDVPPLIHVDKFSFRASFLELLVLPRRVHHAQVENMTITIPPHGQKKAASPDSGKPKKSVARIVIDEVDCKNTVLITLPKPPAAGEKPKEPLEWDLHDLELRSASVEKPFSFHATLTNAKPKGEINTRGEFGPWDVEEPGSSPVSGSYTFTNADLGPFPGIAGILSSTGKFNGRLSELQAEGETDTPDFSLDEVGKPVPLHTEYSATVDGTNGNTVLHPVRATLVHSVFVAKGEVIRIPEKGHQITLDVHSEKARIEDVLRLATKADKPFLTGALEVTTKLLIRPGKEKVLDKLQLDGDFSVTDGQWSSEEVRDKLKSFSQHAEGQPGNEDAGSAVSDFQGHYHLEDGVVTFKYLTFSVPGAAIFLNGTYKLRGEELNFSGTVRLKAKVSQMVTGKKSFFLKAVDPFLSKGGAGTQLPITISGTRDQPVIGVMMFHKKIEKKMGTSPQ